MKAANPLPNFKPNHRYHKVYKKRMDPTFVVVSDPFLPNLNLYFFLKAGSLIP